MPGQIYTLDRNSEGRQRLSKQADCHENRAESHFTNRGKSWSRTEGSSGKNTEKGKVKTKTGQERSEEKTQYR